MSLRPLLSCKTRNQALVVVGVLLALAIVMLFLRFLLECFLLTGLAFLYVYYVFYLYERPLRTYQRIIVSVELIALGLLGAVFLCFVFLYFRQFI